MRQRRKSIVSRMLFALFVISVVVVSACWLHSRQSTPRLNDERSVSPSITPSAPLPRSTTSPKQPKYIFKLRGGIGHTVTFATVRAARPFATYENKLWQDCTGDMAPSSKDAVIDIELAVSAASGLMSGDKLIMTIASDAKTPLPVFVWYSVSSYQYSPGSSTSGCRKIAIDNNNEKSFDVFGVASVGNNNQQISLTASVVVRNGVKNPRFVSSLHAEFFSDETSIHELSFLTPPTGGIYGVARSSTENRYFLPLNGSTSPCSPARVRAIGITCAG